MKKKYIGLNTFLYVFDNSVRMERYRARLQRFGFIVKVFIDNAYGFELRVNRSI